MKHARRVAAMLASVATILVASPDALAEPTIRLAAGDFDRGRLFRIDRAGVPPSYVYGTLHSNDARVVQLPRAVDSALSASRSAAFETLLLEADVGTFSALAYFDDHRRLTDHVDPATVASIGAALRAIGPMPESLERLKPWAVLLMLAQAHDDGAESLDAVLQAEARSRRLAVFSLELPDEQVASLDAVPLVSQLALMRWALDAYPTRGADVEATTRAWLAGDLAGLRHLALKPGRRDAELAMHLRTLLKHLITDRNILMAHRLHLPLARGRVFVAVGALHLQGRDGLLALIRRQGYRITRLLRRAVARGGPGQ